MFVNIYQTGLDILNTSILLNQSITKIIPKCNISLTNGELHQAYGHVTMTNITMMQAEQRHLAAETNKSAIRDHVANEIHVIDWSGVKILDRESHRKTRQLKKSIAYGKSPTV